MGVSKTSDGRYYVYYQYLNKQRKEYFGKDPQGKISAEQKDLFLKLLKKQGKTVFEKHIANEIQEKESALSSMIGSSEINQDIYLDTLAQEFANDLKRRGVSKHYLRAFKSLMNSKVLPKYGEARKPVNNLTYIEVISWFDNITVENDYSIQTRNTYICLVNNLFEFGTKYSLTNRNPLKGLKLKRAYELNFKLTLEGLRTIQRCSPPHLAWAITVAYETAARCGPSELFKLVWDDVNFQENTLHIRGTKTSRANRVIPITDSFKQKLMEAKSKGVPWGFKLNSKVQLIPSPMFIASCKGKQMTDISSVFSSALEKANLPYHVRPYDIRHLSISQMLANGGNLKAISEIAGHSTITTTARYLHTLTNEKERSILGRECL